MRFIKLLARLLIASQLIFSPVAFSASANEIQALFDWAEVAYSEFFPSNQPTLIEGEWTYRHYPETDNYVGVNLEDEVWVTGNDFGDLTLIGPISEVLGTVDTPTTDRGSDIERLLDWAETTYPELFDSEQPTRILGDWRFRFYPATGNYTAVNSNDQVYVMGESFGELDLVDSLSNLLDTLPPPPTINFTALAIDILIDEPRIAYPLPLSITIDANEETSDLGVSLFAIEKNDDPDAPIRQFPLDTQTISQAFAGTHRYEIISTIPASVELPGQYHIAAVVDPVEEISETDEDDNLVSIETAIAETGNPNIFISSLEFDRAALVLSNRAYTSEVNTAEDNIYNPDAGGTLTISTHGLAEDETLAIEAFAALRIDRSDNSTSLEIPLYLWNTDENRYINAYGVDPENNGTTVAEEWLPLGSFNPHLITSIDGEVALEAIDNSSAHMNFYLPGRLTSELTTALRKLPIAFGPIEPPPDLDSASISELRSFLSNLPGDQGDETEALAVTDFSICLKIRPVDDTVIDDEDSDNELCEPIGVYLPIGNQPPPVTPDLRDYEPQLSILVNPLESGDIYSTKVGGKFFAFSMEFGSTATADDRGYKEVTRGAIPITLFGKSFDFESVSVTAQLVPDYAGKDPDENSGYSIEQRHLGLMLYAIDLPPTSPPPLPLVSYSKSAPDPEAEQQFFVGPIPMVASAEVVGNFGVEYQFSEFASNPDDGYKLTSSVATFANIVAGARAGVGVKGFSTGVEGEVRMLDERIVLEGGTTIDVFDLGYESNPADFVITQGITLYNQFSGPQGFLNLFVKYSVPGFKKCSWGFVTGRCPTIKTQKKSLNIWKSKKLFEITDILFESNAVELEVIKYPGEAAAYFTDP